MMTYLSGMNRKLRLIYKKLFNYLGPQYWWPADSSFEVVVGTILTQNTNWRNVEKAIANLKRKNLLNPKMLYHISLKKLAALIKPSGYFNIKAKRLNAFLDVLFNSYQGSIKNMFSWDTQQLRRVLLDIKGIGPETADSILLYAAQRPVFVVDAYTKRIFLRHNFIKEEYSYSQIQELFMKSLDNDARLFNEYHALLVRLGKEICTKNNPRCNICPLKVVFKK